MAEFECSFCRKTFNEQKSLDQHMENKHNGAQRQPVGLHEEAGLREITREIFGVFFGFQARQSVEREMLKLALMTFASLLALGAIGYFGFFENTPNFLEKFGLLLFYLQVGLVANSAAIWHLKAYSNVSCQTGMMIGMTTGMLSGFLVGLIVGISNGMFVGAVAGSLIGIFVGSWAGKCCGIMGILEGQMAGFMAGPMGAMTSIMMVNDNYLLYIPLALFFEIIILGGIMYLVYQENEGQQLNIAKRTAKGDFFAFLAVNFVVLLVLAWLMVFGPKSALFQISLT